MMATGKRRTKYKSPERGLQLAVVKYLDQALPEDAIYHHSPNRALRGPIEISYYKRLGTKFGWPDIEIIYRGWAYGIELKAGKGSLTKSQGLVHADLSRAGLHVAICTSVDEVQAALDGWSIPVRARTFGWVARKIEQMERAA